MLKPILTHFRRFTSEGEIVGRLLTGYANLEVGLLHCVQVSLGDLDKPLKAMFRIRGETRRSNEGVKLAKAPYKALGLEKDFEIAVEAMRHCLAIRNQFSHWVWWDDYSGKLAFANLENVAKRKTRITELRKLKPRHVDPLLLMSQEHYFAYTDKCLAWTNYEGRRLAGKLETDPLTKPRRIKKPKLSLP